MFKIPSDVNVGSLGVEQAGLAHMVPLWTQLTNAGMVLMYWLCTVEVVKALTILDDLIWDVRYIGKTPGSLSQNATSMHIGCVGKNWAGCGYGIVTPHPKPLYSHEMPTAKAGLYTRNIYSHTRFSTDQEEGSLQQ